MKLQLTLLTILFAFFSMNAVAQDSDYEIQQSFKKQYEQYEQEIEQAKSVQELNALIDSVKELNNTYRENADLLDKALYPKTYDNKIKELQKKSLRTRKRQKTIQNQSEDLKKLKTNLADYESRLGNLNNQTDSLQKVLNASEKDSKKLNRTLNEYQKRLKSRDELLLAFIDSMTTANKEWKALADSSLENQQKNMRMKSGDTALQMMQNISGQQIEILQTKASNLRLRDYMRMAEVQYKFEDMWHKLGDRMQKIYEDDDADKITEQVKGNIVQWNQLLKAQIFTSLNNLFDQKNLAVSDFDNGTELYGALSNYTDKKIKESRNEASKTNYKEFKAFSQFWNNVQLKWSDEVIKSRIMTGKQMAAINQKVSEWSAQAKPGSGGNLLVYLLGATLLVAIVLGVMLVRERKKNR